MIIFCQVNLPRIHRENLDLELRKDPSLPGALQGGDSGGQEEVGGGGGQAAQQEGGAQSLGGGETVTSPGRTCRFIYATLRQLI